MGSHRVEHDWSDFAVAAAAHCWASDCADQEIVPYCLALFTEHQEVRFITSHFPPSSVQAGRDPSFVTTAIVSCSENKEEAYSSACCLLYCYIPSSLEIQTLQMAPELCFTKNSMLLLSHFSRVRLCVTPQTAAHQPPPSPGFSSQEQWSGLPFPSPMHKSEKWKWSLSNVRLFKTPWTAAHQAPLPMGFSRQESWLPLPLRKILYIDKKGKLLQALVIVDVGTGGSFPTSNHNFSLHLF